MRHSKILLIGSGQLGSRHLQAIASMQGVREIHVVDSSPDSLDLARKRLDEVDDIDPSVRFFWKQGLESDAANGDLCIVATQAKGRCKIVRDVADQLGYQNFLIEKVVSQSVTEYEEFMNFAANKKLAVWVNCQLRTYPIYKYIRERLHPDENIIFTRIGGNHGLGNNGVHTVELFLNLDRSADLELVGSRIDQELHPSKRGSSLYDLSGTISGSSAKGSDFILSFAGNSKVPAQIFIQSPNARFMVSHFHKWAMESSVETNWQWQPLQVIDNTLVSYTTRQFATDIIESGHCELPSLAECFPPHRFILQALKPHFDTLMNSDNEVCPIT